MIDIKTLYHPYTTATSHDILYNNISILTIQYIHIVVCSIIQQHSTVVQWDKRNKLKITFTLLQEIDENEVPENQPYAGSRPNAVHCLLLFNGQFCSCRRGCETFHSLFYCKCILTSHINTILTTLPYGIDFYTANVRVLKRQFVKIVTKMFNVKCSTQFYPVNSRYLT